jgi:hypothetical protein
MATQAQPASTPVNTDQDEIRIVSHSNLFYWWPLWAVGFILAGLTYIDGSHLAIVPPGTEAYRDATVTAQGQAIGPVDVLVVPKGKRLPAAETGEPAKPYLHLAENRGYGVLYTAVLILLILFTNVPLRGLWSIGVVVVVVLLAIIFRLADWWGPILSWVRRLDIHINAGGYLMISTALFIIWLITFVFFDPQIYMVFTPGQLRVHQEIGGGEVAYDTMGMMIQKQRNDLFRHWILGLGSGDLIVNTSGASAHHFDLPNVLFVGYKVRQIEEMLREKPVVQGR